MKFNYEERFLEIENQIYSLLSTNDFQLLIENEIIYQKLKTLNNRIKEYVRNNGFTNLDKEIHFLKNIKPNIYAWFKTLIYIKKMEAKLIEMDFNT